MSLSWKRSQVAFVGVILANLASLAAIWWYGWQAHALLLVYWLETGVVGAVYVAKIRRAEGTDPASIPSLTGVNGETAESYVGKPNREIADAFVSSYAGVWAGAGAVLVLLPLTQELSLEPASPGVVAIAAVSLVGYHLLSYRYEYVGDREYERRGPVSLAVEPAPRFWVLMLAIIFGLGAADLSRSPMGAIVVLAFFKTCAELVIHRRERKRAIAAASGSRETTV